MVNAKEMALAAAKALDSKKGRDIKAVWYCIGTLATASRGVIWGGAGGG